MFITALFKIAKTWKQPKCPLTDKDVLHTHTHTHTHTQWHTTKPLKWNNANCSNMDGPRDYHNKTVTNI